MQRRGARAIAYGEHRIDFYFETSILLLWLFYTHILLLWSLRLILPLFFVCFFFLVNFFLLSFTISDWLSRRNRIYVTLVSIQFNWYWLIRNHWAPLIYIAIHSVIMTHRRAPSCVEVEVDWFSVQLFVVLVDLQ